ncbi:MAG: GMP synthase [Pseudomonadales bacterium]|nr:GMP synthase [Pseudomonadales bacterium]
MKIGILLADVLGRELRSTFGGYDQMFMRLLSAAESDISYRVYNVVAGEYPSLVDEVDAYLITGSKASVYDNAPWIKTLAAFVKKLHSRKKALIGICFGHQLIAHVLGGHTEKSAKGWGAGLQSYTLGKEAKDFGFDAEHGQFYLLATHQDQVEKIATGAKVLAGNDFCPIAMCAIDGHILTMQGHPEFIPEYAAQLFSLHRQHMGESVYQSALKSLTSPASNALIASWLLSFLRQALKSG